MPTFPTISTSRDATGECVASALPVLDRAEADRRAGVLRALADPVRLQLLSIIASAPDREACVCDMTDAVEVSQPTVSHHLKVLTEAGVLTRERRGTWAWFRLESARLEEIRGFLA
jgi:ArsR family transcriptional regulator